MDTNAESLPQDPVQDSSIQRGVGWGSSTGKDNRNDLSRNNLAWLSASRAGEAANVEADAGDERFAATRNYETPQAAHGFFSSLDAGGDSTDSEAEDARVCPGLLYSCCPCLRCMRPKRQRTRDGSMVKGRSQLSLTTPLLRSDSSDNDRNLRERELPKDVKLIEVELVSARDLPAGDPEIKASNAYVQVRVLPLQDGVGEQAKQSSVIVGTCNPRWGNGQAFTFFVTNQSNASLLFSVMHRIHNSRGPLQASAGLALGVRRSAYTDIPLGEGMVDILQLFPGHSSSRVRAGQDGRAVAGRRVSVVLRDPTTKRRTASTLQLNLRCRYVNEILHTTDHRIYEHQYWSKVAGWMAIDRTTKGKWTTVDGTLFSDRFEEVAPPPEGDSEVVLPWCPFGGWEYKAPSRSGTGDEQRKDADAQEQSQIWLERQMLGAVERRRLWRRVCVKPSVPVTEVA